MQLQQKNILPEFSVIYLSYIALYFTTVFGWALQRNMLYFLLISYFFTSACHNIENSNFYKFLAE